MKILAGAEVPVVARGFLPEGGMVPPFERLRLQFTAMQIVADVLLILGAHLLAAFFYLGNAGAGGTMLAGELIVPIFIVIAFYNAVYSSESLGNWKSASLRMVVALGLAAAMFAFFTFYAKANADFSRVGLTLGLIGSSALLAGSRLIASKWIHRRFGPGLSNVLTIEDGGPPLAPVGGWRISALDHGLSPALDDPHGLDRLARHLRNMDKVIVSCPPERRAAWSLVLKGSGLHGEIVSDLAHDLGALGLRRYEAAGHSTLIVSVGPLNLRARAAKRLFDIVFASAGLLVLSPLIGLAALLVLAEDRGPVLFRQQRMGRGNRFFTLYKFRTMAVAAADAEGSRSVTRDDDRVTRIGKMLRRTSIDELPQLFNVLIGEMSIVGPRPHAIGSHAAQQFFWEIDRRYWQRHALKPGITGLAQIRGLRGATHRRADLELRLQSDLEYINGWSILRDVRIIFLTIRVMIHHDAY